jgi:hypothetical protein
MLLADISQKPEDVAETVIVSIYSYRCDNDKAHTLQGFIENFFSSTVLDPDPDMPDVYKTVWAPDARVADVTRRPHLVSCPLPLKTAHLRATTSNCCRAAHQTLSP